MFMFVVIPDIFLDYIDGDFITYGTYKIPILPKFASPELALNLWKLLEHRPRT